MLENPAEEPEIVDLANYLNQMGARVRGAGTNVITIEGVSELHGVQHSVIPDRIEAGTYMIAAAMTGGDVIIENVLPEHQKPLIAKLREAGALVEEDIDRIHVASDGNLKAVDIKTLPYPGFPTDSQAAVMAMLSVAHGTSVMIENIFENRYRHVRELCRLGADIMTEGKVAVIKGVETLTGACVCAADLRAGTALAVAGLAAQGETQVMHPQYIDRGYAHFEENLRALGADVYRI